MASRYARGPTTTSFAGDLNDPRWDQLFAPGDAGPFPGPKAINITVRQEEVAKAASPQSSSAFDGSSCTFSQSSEGEQEAAKSKAPSPKPEQKHEAPKSRHSRLNERLGRRDDRSRKPPPGSSHTSTKRLASPARRKAKDAIPSTFSEKNRILKRQALEEARKKHRESLPRKRPSHEVRPPVPRASMVRRRASEVERAPRHSAKCRHSSSRNGCTSRQRDDRRLRQRHEDHDRRRHQDQRPARHDAKPQPRDPPHKHRRDSGYYSCGSEANLSGRRVSSRRGSETTKRTSREHARPSSSREKKQERVKRSVKVFPTRTETGHKTPSLLAVTVSTC